MFMINYALDVLAGVVSYAGAATGVDKARLAATARPLLYKSIALLIDTARRLRLSWLLITICRKYVRGTLPNLHRAFLEAIITHSDPSVIRRHREHVRQQQNNNAPHTHSKRDLVLLRLNDEIAAHRKWARHVERMAQLGIAPSAMEASSALAMRQLEDRDGVEDDEHLLDMDMGIEQQPIVDEYRWPGEQMADVPT